MNCNINRQTKKDPRIRKLLAAALALGTIGNAAAQRIISPTTPADITPPAGHSAFLSGHAVGTQGYVCLPKGTGASWTVNGARPEATLFQSIFGRDVQIITHFLSTDANPNPDAPNPLPFGNVTWQSSFDSSRVCAQPMQSIAGGSDASCPNSDAIACVLLQSIGTQHGPTGGRVLAKTTYVQRLNTKGGSAPADGCANSTDVGKQRLVPYTADYYFFHKN